MRRFKGLSILMAVAMLTLLFAGMAFAATDNSVLSKPSFDNDGSVQMGDIRILEGDNSRDAFKNGDSFTVDLPEGVKFDVTGAVTGFNSKNDLVTGSLAGAAVSVGNNVYVDLSSSKRTITVKLNSPALNGNDPTTGSRDYLTLKFPVELDSFKGGDVVVKIDGMDTGIDSGTYVIGRAVDGDATVTALSAETIAQKSDESGGAIRIEETALNAMGTTGTTTIKFTLPSDYTWNTNLASTTTKPSYISFMGGFSNATFNSTVINTSGNKRELTLTINLSSRTSRGIIEIEPRINVDSDANFGEVEVSVEGDEVQDTDVVVAKYADWGLTLSAKDSINEMIAGRANEKLTKLVIDENMAASLLNDRTLTVEFPDYVKIRSASVDRKSGNAALGAATLSNNIRKWSSTVTAGTTETKWEIEFRVSIAVDAPAGDIVATIAGSAGAKGEVVIGKIVPPVTAQSDMKDVIIGEQSQSVSDVLIVEGKKGAILDNGKMILQLPEGVKFTTTPKVEVIEGNIDIDEQNVKLQNDDRELAISVEGESTKASTIKVSGIEITLDRTVAYGGVTLKVQADKVTAPTASALAENYKESPNSTDYEFNALTAAKVVIANVTTPSVENNGTFFIGSTVYSQNGTMKVMDAAPYIKSDRTFVPVRYLAYMLGVTENNVNWDEATQTVTIKKGDSEVQLVIGSTTIMVNGDAKTMDVAPEITNDRTFLPARYVAEGLGYVVGWNPATQSVIISK